jgi:hypothetical protein
MPILFISPLLPGASAHGFCSRAPGEQPGDVRVREREKSENKRNNGVLP